MKIPTYPGFFQHVTVNTYFFVWPYDPKIVRDFPVSICDRLYLVLLSDIKYLKIYETKLTAS